MIDRIDKFLKLKFAEQVLFLRTAVILSMVAVSHRFFGFAKTHSLLCYTKSGDDRQLIDNQHFVSSSARMIDAAARYCYPSASCLDRSHALWWLLRRQGIACELRIGVSKTQSDLAAHAWVEWQGRALNDRADVERRFTPFDQAIVAPGVKSE